MSFKVSTKDHHSMNFSEQDSGELFSDDDKNERNITSRTTNTSKVNDLSLLNLTEVSSMIENVGAPIIPSTPVSLVPFISKINDLWTSDLETPQADKKEQFAVEKSLVSSNEKSIIIKQATPTLLNTENELTSNSPVINCKKIRKRTKRRIFPLSFNLDSLSLSTIEMESKESVNTVETSRSQQEDKTTDITKTHENVVSKIQEVTANNTNQDSHDLDKCFNPLQSLPKTVSIEMNIDCLHSENLLQEGKRENDVDFSDKIPNDSKPDSQSDKMSTQSSGVLMDLFYQLDIENPQKLIFNNDLIADKPVEVSPTIERKHWILDETIKEEKELFIDKLEDAFFDDKNDPLMSIQDNIEGLVVKKEFSIVREEENYEALKKVGGLFLTECQNINKSSITPVGIRNPSMTNFSTARGSSVFVSPNALNRARNLFADEIQEELIVDTEKTISESISKTPLKFIHPSHESSTKSVKMMEHQKPLKSIVNINQKGEKRKASTLFSTASGKSIQISDNALTKANNLFANELQDETNDENSEPKYNETLKSIQVPNTHKNREKSKVSTLFSTASGKSIPISDNALTKAKNVIVDELHGEMIMKTNEENSEQKRVPSIHQNRGKSGTSTHFYTEKGQSIHITKANNLFANELQEGIAMYTDDPLKSIRVPNSKPSTLFSTGSGKSIHISENALAKAKNVIGNELQEEKIMKTNDENSEPKYNETLKSIRVPNTHQNREKSKVSTLFSTASGKSIPISENALAKAKNVIGNELPGEMIMKTNEENSEQKYNETLKTTQISKSNKVSTLFSTASGKSIPISDNALAKANNLLYMDTNVILETKRVSNSKASTLFSTASGKSINISENALTKAKNVIVNELQGEMIMKTNEENSEFKRVPNIHQNKAKSGTSTLFSTEKGQSIHITKTNNLFANELQEGMAMDTNDALKSIRVPNSKPSTLFSTAKGQSIHISDNALTAAKNLLANDFQDETNVDINNQEFKPLVKTVSQISPRPILNNTPVNIQHSNQIETKKSRSIHVSDDALNQAKNLFGDELKSEAVQPFHKYNKTLSKLRQDVSLSIYKEITSTCNIPTASEEIPLLKNSSKFRKHVSASSLGSNKYESLGSRRYSIPLEIKHRLEEFSNQCEKPIQYNKSVSNLVKEQDEIYVNPKMEDDSTLSEEIFASAAALLADEKDEEDNINNKWNNRVDDVPTRSPETSGADVVKPISNIPSSPILGRRDSLCIRKRGKRSLESVSKRMKIIDDDAVVGKNTMRCESQKSDSNNFVDDQLFMDFINESTIILQQRNLAVLEQERLIEGKRKNRPKPTTGRLLGFKKDHSKNRLSWKYISNGCAPVPYVTQELSHNSIPLNIWEITSTTAPSYRFRFTDFYEERIVQYNANGIKVGDDVFVILDQHGCAGVEEFKRAFLTNPGVDLTIVPENWVDNHYRWIVWKLASMDRMKFGPACLPRALTPDRVMYQLKYRYDREIDGSERSALRRILEKDDPSCKRMILCVSSIVDSKLTDCANKNSKLSQWKVLLTDGWYSVPASIDSAMTNYVTSGKIQEGTKIITSGAELLNCSKGCSPLEISNDVSLKIHTNSTRRVRWDTKLGFTSRTNPIPISLKSVCPNGGLIGKLKVVVSRVYPVIYHEKTSTGESIFRNSRSEEKANAAYEQDCRSRMETVYAEAENQFNGPHKSSLDTEDMDIEGSYEQHSYMNRVKKKQQELQEKFQSKLRESLPSPRQVSQVLKVRIFQNETTAIFTIWSPNEEIIDMMKEGQAITICNISASGKRGNELQITANRNTLYHKIGIRNSSYPTRQFISLYDVNPGFDPLYGEFDTVGIVVSSGAIVYNNFECVNIAYRTSDSDKPSYLSILFWQKISAYGYLEILTVGSFIGCCNLEWRKNSSSNITFAYCTERTIFTRNPRQEHLKIPFDELKRSINDPQTFSIQCAEEINIELEKSTMKKISNNQTPDRTISSFAKSSANHQLNHWTPVNKTINDSFNSPSVQKRIAKLSYGDAPRLPPLAIINSSKRVCLDFQSPIRKSDTGKPKNNS